MKRDGPISYRGRAGARGILVLAGMMATGKTSVGRELARRSGRRFVDLDETIAHEASASIADIFAREGEPAFREREREAVRALATLRRAVVATGGWTVADAGSRSVLEALGPVVCLTATPEALAARLDATDVATRPRLEGATTPERVRALLDARRPVYDSLPLQVDTTGRDVVAVADEVLALVAAADGLEMHALPVRTPAGGYAVVVGAGALGALGALARARNLVGRAAVVTDATVNALHGRRAIAALAAPGLRAAVIEMPAGETAKTPAAVLALHEAFLAARIERSDLVIALGGGVVGDTAGFAAATYMRGVRTVIVPTTLLAMVDAAIGGKTGVNLPTAKNLVGAFHHPALVVADPALLDTLPAARLRDGLSEVVKAALIGDPLLLEALRRDGAPDACDTAAWTGIVRRAAAVKAAVVSDDPAEAAGRVRLNLGHTFGHALEVATAWRMSHGEAVAVGLGAAARLSCRLGLAPASLVDAIDATLARLALPTRYAGPAPADVLAAMSADKKRRDGRPRFVLPRGAGDVVAADDVPVADVLAVLAEVRGSGAAGPVDAPARGV